jgi:multicomponent Na+:H+ antiporter subunit D
MIVGSTAAIYQTRLRRVLAYSSIAQIGYMTLGLSLASVTGLTGALIHLFNHALMKGGLFLVAACVIFRVGTTTFDKMRGLGRRMPLTMAAFVVGGLAMIGLPGTAGFVSKWYLVSAALEQGAYTVAIAIVVTSLLAVVYVWRIVEVAYFSPSPPDAPRGDAPLHMLIPTWILVGASVYFGLFTELSVGVASTAAHQLMGVAP